ncbi:MAG: DinB family protein [Fimbriimonadaceae bacterium]|nr:DinB family protein [Fimbriimonadaceae bacterium]
MSAAVALRQIWEGKDFRSPKSVLSRVTVEQAAALPPGFKYSLLTLVEHTDFWQRIWLAHLKGEKAENFMKDWRVPAHEEWPTVRERFLKNFEEALRIAESEPFTHKMKSDEEAISTLAQIAVHNAYHVGQFVLMKRAVSSKSDD